jgi:hypothetical protein
MPRRYASGENGSWLKAIPGLWIGHRGRAGLRIEHRVGSVGFQAADVDPAASTQTLHQEGDALATSDAC